MNEEIIQKLKEVFLPILAERDVDLIKLTLRPQGRMWGVNVFVDKPAGGISIEECAALNRQFVSQLESSLLLGEEFTLEVSSPGIDWLLTTQKDFLRVLGRPLRIFLIEPVAGKTEYAGLLTAAREEGIAVRPLGKQKAQPGIIEIPLVQIRKAVQIIQEGQTYGQ